MVCVFLLNLLAYSEAMKKMEDKNSKYLFSAYCHIYAIINSCSFYFDISSMFCY